MIGEAASPVVDRLLADDPEVTIWWAASVECASAVSRRERSGGMTPAEAEQALQGFGEIAAGWNEVPPGERLRQSAARLVRVHDLRAADALQLAAAVVASESNPEALPLVTLDDRLALAARREGFRVLPA